MQVQQFPAWSTQTVVVSFQQDCVLEKLMCLNLIQAVSSPSESLQHTLRWQFIHCVQCVLVWLSIVHITHADFSLFWYILLYQEALSSVTTMTYSQDDSFFAIGHQNGVLQLWKGVWDMWCPAYLLQTFLLIVMLGLHYICTVCSSASASTEVQQQTPEEKCTEKELLQLESLLIRTQQLNISNKGFKYHSKDDDFTLTVPEGAVPTGDSI